MSITDDLRTDLTNARTRHQKDGKRIEFLEAENERLREALVAIETDSDEDSIRAFARSILDDDRVDDNSAR